MTVRVVKYQMFRDGGTTEYRDEHNRSYFIPAPIFGNNHIYGAYPYHMSKTDGYRDEIRLKDIELEVVDSFD